MSPAPMGQAPALARLSAAMMLGLLSVLAAFFALDPPSRASATALPPVANAGQPLVVGTVCSTHVTTTADSGADSLRSALACASPGDSEP